MNNQSGTIEMKLTQQKKQILIKKKKQSQKNRNWKSLMVHAHATHVLDTNIIDTIKKERKTINEQTKTNQT